MIVVIQCAASKIENAGHLRSATGAAVVFVTQPQTAPPSDTVVYARPARGGTTQIVPMRGGSRH